MRTCGRQEPPLSISITTATLTFMFVMGKPGESDVYNELFINNQDLTFRAIKSFWSRYHRTLGTCAFFDADRDGDLDAYLLNNSIRSVGGYDLIEGQRNYRPQQQRK